MSRFDSPWWYRVILPNTTYPIPILDVQGLNYRANVWVDGQQVANNSQIVGTFRRYLFPLTSTNKVVAFLIWRQHDRALPEYTPDRDLGISFVDWLPYPPDSNLGLYRNVYLHSRPMAIIVDGIGVNTKFITTPAAGVARADVIAEVVVTIHNYESTAVIGDVVVVFDGLSAQVELKNVKIQPHTFSTVSLPSVLLKHAPIWWPWRVGNPSLQNLNVSFIVSGTPIFTANITTGLRQVTSKLDEHDYRLFSVNHYPFAIFGGAYCPDLFMRREGDW